MFTKTCGIIPNELIASGKVSLDSTIIVLSYAQKNAHGVLTRGRWSFRFQRFRATNLRYSNR
ncbi:hypothetical protein HOV93_22310 [Planctomycetes bacterium FF15]|uniref:Uncharacterized protein n=1 Tax=Bremerella alba TaxID=980252 RepID=A0A7V8V5F8_9BACT|nr:hypothetical protein [Bremerella alba]